MKTLFVRVQRKSGAERFFRCGMEFGRAWQKVDGVDDATAKRLEEEQMLEVSEEQPENFEDQTPNAADPAGNALTPGVASDTPAAAPKDEAERLAAIREAIGKLDPGNPALWTVGNKPKTEAIAAITGWPVAAADRDAVVAAIYESEQ